MPVVIDGVISATGAVLAAAICPQAKDYMAGISAIQRTGRRTDPESSCKEAPLHCDMCLAKEPEP